MELSFPLAPAEGYAWPGGYPIAYVMDDSEVLCAHCVNDPSNPVHAAGEADGWRLEGLQVLEGSFEDHGPVSCAHCARVLIPDGDPLERARVAGEEHGRAAASWYFDGNTDAAVYARVLQGIEDGDPEVLDTFPSSPLSGEWADEPTPASVLADLEVDPDSPIADDVLTAYEDGFYLASQDEIERVARYQVSP